MALIDIQDFLRLVPTVANAPEKSVWLTYDAEADCLYINFRRPSYATDSEMTDEDVIVRYQEEEVIGLTVLHASKRARQTA